MNSEISGSPQSSAQNQRGFGGKDYNKFMPIFNKFAANPASFQLSWNWSVFLVSFWWFLYRKMYLLATLCLVTMCIPYVNIIAWFFWAASANHMYYKHIMNKILKLKSLHGENYRLYLNKIAGVNRWVPIFAIIIFLVMFSILGVIAFERFNFYYNQYSNMK